MTSRDPTTILLGALAAVGAALILFTRQRGFVQPELLPYGPMMDPAAERAARELRRWQGLTETDPQAAPLLAEYWQTVGSGARSPGVPWSAAFVSHVAGPALTASGSHVQYARSGYQARGTPGRYWTLRPAEAGRVRSGDILLQGRGKPLSFADLRSSGGFIPSHADIVLTADDTVAHAVGGNVRNSVRLVERRLQDGRAVAPVVAVLRRGAAPLPSV